MEFTVNKDKFMTDKKYASEPEKKEKPHRSYQVNSEQFEKQKGNKNLKKKNQNKKPYNIPKEYSAVNDSDSDTWRPFAVLLKK